MPPQINTKLEAFGEFVRIAHDIWPQLNQFAIPPDLILETSVKIPHGAAAALYVCREAHAGWYGVGKPHLYSACKQYRLVLSDRLMTRDDEAIRKVLIHEALHLGFIRHDQTFKRVCAYLGGARSEREAITSEEERVMLQVKPYGRRKFQDIKAFPTIEQARQFFRANELGLRTDFGPGSRFRYVS